MKRLLRLAGANPSIDRGDTERSPALPRPIRILLLTLGEIVIGSLFVLGQEPGAHPLAALRREGAVIHPSNRETPGRKGVALAFPEGGIEQRIGDLLTPASGGVDLWLQTPADWPTTGDCALFHIGEEAHVHVTLFFRGAALLAVYKGDVDHYSSVHSAAPRGWKPATWHHVEYSWAQKKTTNEVELFLRVDGDIAGFATGQKIERWPDRFYIGARGRTQAPWKGLIEDARVSSSPLTIPELQPGRRTVEVRANQAVGECYNFWSIHNFTSEDMFAKPDQRKITIQRHPYMKTVNCVRFIGGREDGKNEFFLGLDANGKPRYDFAPAVAYLKGIMDWGYTPRIVLDNVPMKMSEPPKMNTYGNTYPPKDYGVYHAYIKALIQRLIDEFGSEVAPRWRFRVMTEPDLYPGHWAGTKEEWLRLYDTAVDAVTQLIPDADIGPGNILNPAGGESGKRPKWGLDIIDHAATGKNYYTGKTGTRLRFFSCSWYGGVGKPVDEFDTAIGRMRERLGRYPQFKDTPIEVAEFGVLTDDNNRRFFSGEATEWSGSWLAAIADRAWRLDVRQIHLWAVNSGLLATPYTHVLWMLEQMAGGQRLAVDVASNQTKGGETSGATKAECGAAACRKDGRLLIMLYNHRALRKPQVAEHVILRVRDARMKDGAQWKVSEWGFDAEHGVFIRALYKDIEAAGLEPLPDSPVWGSDFTRRFGDAARTVFEKNRSRYAQLAQLPQLRKSEPLAVGDGEAVLEFDMPGHSVRFLELTAE